MSLKLAERGHAWDAAEAEKRVRAWAKAEDAPNAKYAEAFFWHAKDASKFGDYKLPFADVAGDSLVAVPRAIFAVAAVLDGGRGGVDIPAADKTKVKAQVSAYYAQMRKEFDDDSIKAPWERSEPVFETRDLEETRFYDCETEVRVVDSAKRVVDLSFSSETPIQRPWGREILDHTPGSIRMTRLNKGAPVLLNHDTDKHVGVVESAHIGDDRKGRARVRFSSSPQGEEVFNDVKDGIRRGVSVGYRYHAAPVKEDGDGVPTYRFKDWEPMELSIASLPADTSVGIGRSINHLTHEVPQVETKTPEQIAADQAAAVTVARTGELDRMRRINALADKWGKRDEKISAEAPKFIENGRSVEEFRDFVFERLEATGVAVRAEVQPLGLKPQEKRKFSLTKLINSLSDPNDRKLREIAAFEHEVVEAAAKQPNETGGERRGVHIPVDVLSLTPDEKREIQVGGTGAELVATNLLAQDFIDLLRIKTQVMKLGPTVLPGLVGNVAIPAQSGPASVYWVAESTAPTESDAAFTQVTLSPSTIAANTKYSRKTLLQATPAIEGLVRNDLTKVMAIGVDAAAINGSGASGQPTGILQTSGIGSVALGTNGGAPTWAGIVSMEEQLGNANALFGNLGFLTNSRVKAALAQTPKIGSTFPVFLLEEPYNELLGYKFVVDNNVPNTLSKGTGTGLSAAIFGNWSDLIIGEWGGFDMIVDPYSYSTQGGVQITVFQSLAIAVRHAASFCADVDIIAS